MANRIVIKADTTKGMWSWRVSNPTAEDAAQHVMEVLNSLPNFGFEGDGIGGLRVDVTVETLEKCESTTLSDLTSEPKTI